MAILTPNGFIETQEDGTQRIVAPNTGTWNDLSGSTWDTWRSFTLTPAATLTWLTEIADLGEQTFFTVTTTADIVGNVTYYVYTSSTGEFAGEEDTTVIVPGDENIFGFFGRYCMIGISVDYDPGQGDPAIRAFDFTCSGKFLTLLISNQNSSELDAYGSARVLPMPKPISRVINAQITTHISEDYVAADYVAADYFETGESTYPSIVSKGVDNLIVKFITPAGAATDAVFDAVVYCLPELYMNGNDLSVR